MKIVQEEIEKVLVVSPEGKLDSQTCKALETVLTEAVTEGTERLLLDFSRLVYISSSGLRIILVTAKQLEKGKGQLALCGLDENVRQVFEMSGLHRFLDIEESRETALSRYF